MTLRSSIPIEASSMAAGGDFYLATSGDFYLAVDIPDPPYPQHESSNQASPQGEHAEEAGKNRASQSQTAKSANSSEPVATKRGGPGSAKVLSLIAVLTVAVGVLFLIDPTLLEVPIGRFVRNTYPVTVNYDLPVEDAVMKFDVSDDWAGKNITSFNFRTTQEGVAEVAVALVRFNRAISFDGILHELERRGYRPAELRELLAFGEKYPDILESSAVVALDSVLMHPQPDIDEHYVPVLRRVAGGGTNLTLTGSSMFSDSSSLVHTTARQFAAVRK